MASKRISYYYNDGEIEMNDCSVKYTIRDIFWFPEALDTEIRSPTFSAEEITWRLRVFPWGRKTPSTHGWLGVALCACGPPDTLDGKSFSIRFSIIGKSGEVVSSPAPGRRKIWYVTNKLIRSQKLKSERNEIAPDDVLTIVCDIRNEMLGKLVNVSDDKEIVELHKASGIIHGKVSINTGTACESYNQTTTSQDGDGIDHSVTENYRKYDSGDCSASFSDTESYLSTVASSNAKSENYYSTVAPSYAESEIYYSTVEFSDTETESDNSTVCEEYEYDRAKYETTVGEQLSALPKGVAKALQDYKELLLSETHSNITIKVRNKEFKAHKGILAARNPVFAAMLRHNMKEKATGVVTIEDIDPKVFPDFLEYLYTGQVQNLCSDNVLELFAAADMYQIKELREECFVYMKENLSVETFSGILSLSLRHHEKELIALATQFFIENAVDIVKTPKWQIFMMENAVAANELFIRQLEFSKRNQK